MSGGIGWLRIYLADIRPLYQEAIQRRVYERLDETRRRKADACKQPGAKAASLAAGFLARHALWDNGYADWKVCYGETGQPFVRRECMTEQARPALAAGPATDAGTRGGRRAEAAPYISLSHSGDYAVCAISDRPVGVDIQKIQPVRYNMLRHFFAEEEECAFRKRCGLEGSGTERECRAYPAAVQTKRPSAVSCERSAAAQHERSTAFLPEDAAREFLRLWTVKESYMKLAGTGLVLGLSNVAADLERGEAWLKLPAPKDRKTCRVRELKAPDGYFLTACIGGMGAWQEKVSTVEFETIERREKPGINACFNEREG